MYVCTNRYVKHASPRGPSILILGLGPIPSAAVKHTDIRAVLLPEGVLVDEGTIQGQEDTSFGKFELVVLFVPHSRYRIIPETK